MGVASGTQEPGPRSAAGSSRAIRLKEMIIQLTSIPADAKKKAHPDVLVLQGPAAEIHWPRSFPDDAGPRASELSAPFHLGPSARGLFVYSSVITDFPAGAGACRGVDSRAPLMMLTSGLKGKRAREKYKREGVLKGRLLSPIRTLGFSPWGLNPESECL